MTWNCPFGRVQCNEMPDALKQKTVFFDFRPGFGITITTGTKTVYWFGVRGRGIALRVS